MDDEAVTPDTKDWTWVLSQRCPECGLDAQGIAPDAIREWAPRYIARFRERLEEDEAASTRPAEGVWAPVEYGAHVRDVCVVFRARVRAMLLHDEPSYPDWDQDEAAISARYLEQSPRAIADELAIAADDFLRDLAELSTVEYDRTGRRSDGYLFTVRSLLQYFFHELVHHWWDVSGETFGE